MHPVSPAAPGTGGAPSPTPPRPALRVVQDGTAGVEAVLARCDWLAGCDPVVLAALAATGTVVGLGRREELPGTPAGGRVVVLLAGRLAVSHDADRGPTTWLGVAHAPATTLGLEDALTGRPGPDALRALDEPTSVLVLPAAAVRAAVAAHPSLGLAVAQHLARRVQQLGEQARDLAVLDVRRRAAKYLALRADADGRTPGLRQPDLARRLGASRQSVNAALTSFVRRGWLTPPAADGSHRVLDPAALAACGGVAAADVASPGPGALLH